MRRSLSARRLGVIAGALLVGSAGLGCRSTTTVTRSEANPNKSTGTPSVSTAIRPDAAITRADFRPKADQGQQIGVHLQMAQGHEGQGMLEAAAVDYQKAIEALGAPGRMRSGSGPRTEQRSTAHRKLGVVLDRLGRFSESEVHYKAALKLAPDDPKVWNNAGYSDYIQGRFADAETKLRTAVRLAPGEPKAAVNLGLALAAGGKRDEALSIMTAAVGAPAAQANLGYVLAATGKRAEAADAYRRALALQPDLGVANQGLAQLARADGPAAGPSTTATVGLPPLPTDPAVGRASSTPSAGSRPKATAR